MPVHVVVIYMLFSTFLPYFLKQLELGVMHWNPNSTPIGKIYGKIGRDALESQ